MSNNPSSLEHVDREEQADPDHVDEVPVVGHHDRADRLLMGELARQEGAAEHQQERDQATDHVDAVEAGGEEEHRPVGRVGDGHALLNEGGVLQGLAADEDRAHDVGQDEPLSQAPLADLRQAPLAADLAALGGEDAQLAGHRGQHQDRGEGQRQRHLEQRGVLGPQIPADRADGEVGREEGREEHQLAGEPDDRAHCDHARPVVVPVKSGCRNSRRRRHRAIMARALREGTPTPLCGPDLECRVCRCSSRWPPAPAPTSCLP